MANFDFARFARVLRSERPVVASTSTTGIVGSVTAILIWALGQLQVEMPPEIAASVVAVVVWVAQAIINRRTERLVRPA